MSTIETRLRNNQFHDLQGVTTDAGILKLTGSGISDYFHNHAVDV